MNLRISVSVNNGKSKVQNTINEGVKGKDLKKKIKKKKTENKGGFKRKAIPVYKVEYIYPDGRSNGYTDIRHEGDTTFMIRDICNGFRSMRGRKGVKGCGIRFYTTTNNGQDVIKHSNKVEKRKETAMTRTKERSHISYSQYTKGRMFYEVNF